MEVAVEQLYHVPEQLCWLWLGGLSTAREMRYLNMSRILELAQQGKIYLCQAIPGFSNLLPIIASERKFIFLSLGFFLFVWVFFFP